MGLSEDEFWSMQPREFRRRERAWANRTEQASDADWSRTLYVVNTIRGLVKAPAVTLEELKERAAEAEGGEAVPTADEMNDMWKRIEAARAAAAAAHAPADPPAAAPPAKDDI